MGRREFFDYVKEQYGVDPDYPWNDWNAVFRHPDNSKWFALVMEVGRDKLGLADDSVIDIVNLKSDLMLISTLQANQGFFPAYHMNKENWDQCCFGWDGTGRRSEKLIRHELSDDCTEEENEKAGEKVTLGIRQRTRA